MSAAPKRSLLSFEQHPDSFGFDPTNLSVSPRRCSNAVSASAFGIPFFTESHQTTPTLCGDSTMIDSSFSINHKKRTRSPLSRDESADLNPCVVKRRRLSATPHPFRPIDPYNVFGSHGTHEPMKLSPESTPVHVDVPETPHMALLPPLPDLIPLEDEWNQPDRPKGQLLLLSNSIPTNGAVPFSRRPMTSFDAQHRPTEAPSSPDINVLVVPPIHAVDSADRQKQTLALFAGTENVGRKYVMTENGDMIFRPLHMKCTHCSEYFKKTHALYQHIRTHQNHTQCPHCTKRLTCMATFVYHVRTHTGEKPYYCPLHSCNFRNAVKYNLKVHLASRRHGGKSNLKKYAKVLDEDVCDESLKKRKDDSVHELGSRRSKKRKKLEEQNKAAADAAARHHALAANLTSMPYGWSYEQMGARLLMDTKWMQDVKFNPNSPNVPPGDPSVDMKPNILSFTSTAPSTSPNEDCHSASVKTSHMNSDLISSSYSQRFSAFPLLNTPSLFNTPYMMPPSFSSFGQQNSMWNSQIQSTNPQMSKLMSSSPIPPLPPVSSYTSFLSADLLGSGPTSPHGGKPYRHGILTPPQSPPQYPAMDLPPEIGEIVLASSDGFAFLKDDDSGSTTDSFVLSPLPVTDSPRVSPTKQPQSSDRAPRGVFISPSVDFTTLSGHTVSPPRTLPNVPTFLTGLDTSKNITSTAPGNGVSTAFHLQPDDEILSSFFETDSNQMSIAFCNGFSLASTSGYMDECKDESP